MTKSQPVPGPTSIDNIELVGGHPALDCINSVHAWSGDTPGRDYLVDYASVLAWHLRLELIDQRQAGHFRALDARAGGAALRRFRELRMLLHGIFRAVAVGCPPPPRDLDGLGRFLVQTQRYRRLHWQSGAIAFAWGFRDAPATALTGPVAWQAVELLTKGALERIKECPPPDGCGWLFLDTSRNRSRQWCSMKTCGNLAKVRRFRARRG